MTGKVALLALGSSTFALAIGRIVHILPASAPFSLPLMRAGVIGALVDREEIVPVLDPAVCFTVGTGGGAIVPQLHVVYESEAGRVALPVDRILQMVDGEQGVIRAPETAACSDFKQVFFFQGREIPLLDIDELVVAPCEAKATISIRIEEA